MPKSNAARLSSLAESYCTLPSSSSRPESALDEMRGWLTRLNGERSPSFHEFTQAAERLAPLIQPLLYQALDRLLMESKPDAARALLRKLPSWEARPAIRVRAADAHLLQAQFDDARAAYRLLEAQGDEPPLSRSEAEELAWIVDDIAEVLEETTKRSPLEHLDSILRSRMPPTPPASSASSISGPLPCDRFGVPYEPIEARAWAGRLAIRKNSPTTKFIFAEIVTICCTHRHHEEGLFS